MFQGNAKTKGPIEVTYTPLSIKRHFTQLCVTEPSNRIRRNRIITNWFNFYKVIFPSI